MHSALIKRPKFFVRLPSLLMLLLCCTSCSQNFTVSVNNQAVFDPSGRLFNGQLADPGLQACVNIAMQQQGVQDAGLLQVLSCANAEIETLDNIAQLGQLRFLNLANNNIRNITPLEELGFLGGLNLMNNSVTDVASLLNMATLASVNLVGNNEILCSQLQVLADRLGSKLTQAEQCRN